MIHSVHHYGMLFLSFQAYNGAMDKLRHKPWFETAYKIGVALKGVDGLFELVTGLVLLASPSLIHTILTAIIGHAHKHTGHAYHFIGEYVAHVDQDLARSGLAFLIIFLVAHGIIKLVLVYCLFRRITWAYPYALGVLVLFLIYQVYVLIKDPLSPALWLFTILDIVIIWLVWGEWRDLLEVVKKPKPEKQEA